MKLWMISQEENTNYDSYDSAVVAAETEDEARMMRPSDGTDIGDDPAKDYWEDWAKTVDGVKCEYIGEAKDGTPKSVICASFNAG